MTAIRRTRHTHVICVQMGVMGKGWAKGLTQESDARIARAAAAAHRGLRYSRRRPREEDRRTSNRIIQWTPELAYAVGLIVTDGGLVGKRHIAFKSKDLQLSKRS